MFSISTKILTVLVVVVLLATAIRFTNLHTLPVGLTNDEASTAYDAYSLLLTGKDQWDKPFPITSFKSFGDNRSPFYTYATIPVIMLLGMTEYAVRAVSALSGVLLVVVMFLLGRELFKSDRIGLIAAILTAINPWMIGLSRIGNESIVATLFVSTGILFFLYSQKRTYFIYIAALFAVAAFYTYSASILFVPLYFLVLIITHRSFVKKQKKHIFIASAGVLLLTTPLFVQPDDTSGVQRFQQVNITNDVGILDSLNEKRGTCSERYNATICRLSINRPAAYSHRFLENYIHHFSPQLLAFSGTTTQHSVLPERGLLYLFEFVFFLKGLYYLFVKRTQSGILLISWLLLTPLADSITGSGHFMRSLLMVVPILLITSYGLYTTVTKLKSTKLAVSTVVIVIAISFMLFIVEYTTFFPTYYSHSSHYGYKDLMDYVEQAKNDYDTVYISSKIHGERQYIFYLFFTQFDPIKFQKKENISSIQENNGWIRISQIDNIVFVPKLTSIKENGSSINSLQIGDPKEFPKDIPPAHTVYDLRGNPLFIAVETKEIEKYIIENNSVLPTVR